MCVYSRKVERILNETSVSLAMDRNGSLCSTNGTLMTGTKLMALWLVMFVIYATIIVFTAIVLSLVVVSNTIRGTIRFVLVNILIASITVCFGFALMCIRILIINNLYLFTHSDVSFQILLAIMAIGENGKSAFMAVFAVVVVVIMKDSNSAVKFKYLIISVVVVWITCVAVGAILVVPGVVELSPCSTGFNFQPGNQIWIFGASYFLFIVTIPFTLAIFMPVYALCYIRSNLVSENASSLKPMLKFILFLLLGNGVSVFGNASAVVGSLIIKDANVGNEVAWTLRRLHNVLLLLSLISTPILIIIYFKPVQILMKKCVLKVCSKCCKRRLVPSRQDPLTEMMLASPADNDL